MHSFLKRHPAWAGGVAGLLSSLVVSSQSGAQVVALPAFNADIKETSVSGLSSGGFMAVQFDVAYSSIIKGAGVIAGGPYFCARGNLNTATTVCSCTLSPFFCQVAPGGTNVPELIKSHRSERQRRQDRRDFEPGQSQDLDVLRRCRYARSATRHE